MKTQALNENKLIDTKLTFEQFLKNPITAMLFMSIFALAYFIYDMKQVSVRQEERILYLEQEVKKATNEIATLREENSALKTELLLRKGKL